MQTLQSWMELNRLGRRLSKYHRATDDYLVIRGYFEPIIQDNDSVNRCREVATRVEDLTISGFQNLETLALQSPEIRDPKNNLRRYGSLVYVVDNNLLVSYFDISLEHSIPSSSDPYVQKELQGVVMPASLRFCGHLSLGKYQPQSIEAIKLLWSLISGFSSDIENIIPESGDLTKAGPHHIVLFKNKKSTATGYPVLDELGLNLPRDKQRVYFGPLEK
jgi:hypothetical protein